MSVLDSIVVSIPACHAGDRGSIPRRGDYFLDEICGFLSMVIRKILEKKFNSIILTGHRRFQDGK